MESKSESPEARVPAGSRPSQRTTRHRPTRIALRPTAAVLLAISLGLCGGYLDLFLMLFKKFYWKDEWILRYGRDFPWTVPVAHALLLLIPGIVIAALCYGWGRDWSRCAPASWLLATLARSGRLCCGCHCTAPAAFFWPPAWVEQVGEARSRPVPGRRGRWGYSLTVLLGLLCVLAAGFSSGQQVIREKLAVAGLPPPPPDAKNVLLIVWDTVRANNLSRRTAIRGSPLPTWARWGACRASGITSLWALTPVDVPLA